MGTACSLSREGAPATAAFPGHPAFLLYAGTRKPGVAEINGFPHGGAPILVADTFGPRVSGTWERGAGGRLTARLGRAARRIEWREDATGGGGRVLRPAMLPPRPGDAAADRAALEGLVSLAARLGMEDPSPVAIYV